MLAPPEAVCFEADRLSSLPADLLLKITLFLHRGRGALRQASRGLCTTFDSVNASLELVPGPMLEQLSLSRAASALPVALPLPLAWPAAQHPKLKVAAPASCSPNSSHQAFGGASAGRTTMVVSKSASPVPHDSCPVFRALAKWPHLELVSVARGSASLPVLHRLVLLVLSEGRRVTSHMPLARRFVHALVGPIPAPGDHPPAASPAALRHHTTDHHAHQHQGARLHRHPHYHPHLHPHAHAHLAHHQPHHHSHHHVRASHTTTTSEEYHSTDTPYPLHPPPPACMPLVRAAAAAQLMMLGLAAPADALAAAEAAAAYAAAHTEASRLAAAAALGEPTDVGRPAAMWVGGTGGGPSSWQLTWPDDLPARAACWLACRCDDGEILRRAARVAWVAAPAPAQAMCPMLVAVLRLVGQGRAADATRVALVACDEYNRQAAAGRDARVDEATSAVLQAALDALAVASATAPTATAPGADSAAELAALEAQLAAALAGAVWQNGVPVAAPPNQQQQQQQQHGGGGGLTAQDCSALAAALARLPSGCVGCNGGGGAEALHAIVCRASSSADEGGGANPRALSDRAAHVAWVCLSAGLYGVAHGGWPGKGELRVMVAAALHAAAAQPAACTDDGGSGGGGSGLACRSWRDDALDLVQCLLVNRLDFVACRALQETAYGCHDGGAGSSGGEYGCSGSCNSDRRRASEQRCLEHLLGQLGLSSGPSPSPSCPAGLTCQHAWPARGMHAPSAAAVAAVERLAETTGSWRQAKELAALHALRGDVDAACAALQRLPGMPPLADNPYRAASVGLPALPPGSCLVACCQAGDASALRAVLHASVGLPLWPPDGHGGSGSSTAVVPPALAPRLMAHLSDWLPVACRCGRTDFATVLLEELLPPRTLQGETLNHHLATKLLWSLLLDAVAPTCDDDDDDDVSGSAPHLVPLLAAPAHHVRLHLLQPASRVLNQLLLAACPAEATAAAGQRNAAGVDQGVSELVEVLQRVVANGRRHGLPVHLVVLALAGVWHWRMPASTALVPGCSDATGVLHAAMPVLVGPQRQDYAFLSLVLLRGLTLPGLAALVPEAVPRVPELLPEPQQPVPERPWRLSDPLLLISLASAYITGSLRGLQQAMATALAVAQAAAPEAAPDALPDMPGVAAPGQLLWAVASPLMAIVRGCGSRWQACPPAAAALAAQLQAAGMDNVASVLRQLAGLPAPAAVQPAAAPAPAMAVVAAA